MWVCDNWKKIWKGYCAGPVGKRRERSGRETRWVKIFILVWCQHLGVGTAKKKSDNMKRGHETKGEAYGWRKMDIHTFEVSTF